MMKTTPKNFVIVFAVIVIVSLFYIFIYWPITPLGSQMRNMKMADEQASLLRNRFKDDLRFQQIKFYKDTEYGGSLKVFGNVSSEEDFVLVTSAVESVKSPVGIYFELMTTNQSVVFTWFDRGRDTPLLKKADTP